MDTPDVVVIVPAKDEAATVGDVVREVPGWVSRVIVVDNGSVDGTAEVARAAGATVLRSDRVGYGAACLAALDHLRALGEDPVVAFMVADGSDDPRELPRVVDPVREGRADLVIGSRTRGYVTPGAMPAWQRAGSLFAAGVLTLRYGSLVTDLGPMRAIRRSTLDALSMRDPSYGWTLEMQIKAARAGLRVIEAPVSWRPRRAGEPKVGGTWKGSLGASKRILAWLGGAIGGASRDPR